MSIVKFEHNEDQYKLLRKTIAKDLTDEEFDLFVYICKGTNLDPLIKQIYPIRRHNVMTTLVGIDGLRTIAERTKNYTPGKETLFQYNKEGALFSATVYVKKRTSDGTWHETSATAIYSEYRPTHNSPVWKEKPHIMLAKCAESLAIRRAFPADTANLYTAEEMGSEQTLEMVPVNEIEKDEPLVISHKKIDPEPNDTHSESNYKKALYYELESEGISTQKLDEWLHLRTKTVNKPIEYICQQCLTKFSKFKEAFIKWLEDSISNPEPQAS